MNSPEFAEKSLKEIVARIFKKPIDEIQMESRLREDLGADSLDLIVLLHEIEDQFDITVTDEEAQKVLTVGDAVRMAAQIAPK